MSKERELLQRLVDSGVLGGYRFIAEVKELLAQPEQEPSSDDYMYNQLKENYDDLVESSLKDFQRGFASALNLSVNVDIPKREPLSDEEINECMENSDSFGFNGDVYIAEAINAFENFARAIEKAHGIGVK